MKDGEYWFMLWLDHIQGDKTQFLTTLFKNLMAKKKNEKNPFYCALFFWYNFYETPTYCLWFQVYPSGWIIEPAKQDKRVYSIVTYLMQVIILINFIHLLW